MHCLILANSPEAFPPALLPHKGRAVIDHLIDDALLQKDITVISVLTNKKTHALITKHLENVFPNSRVQTVISQSISKVASGEEDIIILEGAASTSLKLQDFIRYFKQFKTITKAAYDKLSPREIPFYIIPKKDRDILDKIQSLPSDRETHTYNCGTGYFTMSTSF